MGTREPATVGIEELNRRPHDVFRLHRPLTPFLKRDDGIYVAIRAADVERPGTDPHTRQLQTEIARSRGVSEGESF